MANCVSKASRQRVPSAATTPPAEMRARTAVRPRRPWRACLAGAARALNLARFGDAIAAPG